MYYRAYTRFAAWKRQYVTSDRFISFEDIAFTLVLPLLASSLLVHSFPSIPEHVGVSGRVLILGSVVAAFAYISVMDFIFRKPRGK
jgi:uncharacterized membrane protein YeiB